MVLGKSPRESKVFIDQYVKPYIKYLIKKDNK